MAELKIALLPTGMTYSRNTKAPLEDKRIFNTLALAQEYVNDVDQTAYVGLTISVVNDGANNGLYYIERIADANNATGLLVKIGSDSAADIANLQSDVNTLKSTVGDSTSGLVADMAGKADAFTVGDGIDYTDNVVKVAISATEGNSLSVNSDGLYVAVPEIEVPEYTLEAVSNSDSAYASQYQLKKDGVAVGATINIPKDQFLKDASFHATAEDGVAVEAPYLKFVWDLDINEDLEGIQNVTYVPVKDLVDTYTAGNYITITQNSISVNTTDLFAAIDTEFDLTNIAAELESVKTVLGDSKDTGIVADVETIKSDINTINDSIYDLTQNSNNFASGLSQVQSDIRTIKTDVNACKVKDVDTTSSYGVNLSLIAPDGEDTPTHVKVNVDIDTLAAEIIAKHEVPAPIAKNISVETIGSYVNSDDKQWNVQTVLADLDTRITSAVSGGLTKVDNGFGINVSEVSGNKQTISVKTSDLIATGSALQVIENKIDLVWSEL